MKIINLKIPVIRSKEEEIQINLLDGFHDNSDSDRDIARFLVYILRNRISQTIYEHVQLVMDNCDKIYEDGNRLRNEIERKYKIEL